MTVPLRSTPRLSAVPASQNTAPVAEFRCLFTHDIRRKKQKRWQDGYLKLHTFNNRVMVYDISRNYIGDTFWKDSNELQEGDELTLDKGGVMVEVADAMGVTQTDLTPLFEKKSPQAKPPVSRPPLRPVPRPSNLPGNALRTGLQLKHKSLNTLLGTPKGPIGKAVAITSPYEQRLEKQKEKENEWAQPRATKRQKLDHSPANVQFPSPVQDKAEGKDVSLWPRTSDAKKATSAPQSIPRGATVIDVDSTPENISSDLVTLPSTPAAPRNVKPQRTVTSAPVPRPAVPKELLAQTTPRVPKEKVPLPRKRAAETPQLPLQASSPPISVTNRLSNVDLAPEPVRKPSRESSPPPSPPPNRTAKALRLPTGKKRGMLLCQSLPPKPAEPPPGPASERPVQQSEKNQDKNRGKKKEEDFCDTNESGLGALTFDDDDDDSLGQIASPGANSTSNRGRKRKSQSVLHTRQPSKKSDHSHSKRKQSEQVRADSSECKLVPSSFDVDEEPILLADAPEDTAIIGRKWKSQTAPKARQSVKTRDVESSSSDAFDDIEVIHGFMDQQLIPRKSPKRKERVRLQSPPVLKSVKPRIQKAKPRREEQLVRGTSPPTDSAPKASGSKSARAAKNPKEARRKRNASPTVTSAIPVQPVARVPSETPSETLSRPSTSGSPPKSLLSTGGFRKKAKKDQTPKTPVDANNSRPITVALPPHPLTANRSGPLLSGPELSAQLRKPQKHARIEEDPIEDETSIGSDKEKRKSPTKKSFRRVRSANDASIPSTSEEWERRNLHSSANLGVEVAADLIVAHDPPATKSKAQSGLAALVKKTDPRRKFQRTQSLTVHTSIDLGLDPEIVSPPIDTDVGPWSTEAFDLFDWRPPAKDGEDAGIGLLVDKQ